MQNKNITDFLKLDKGISTRFYCSSNHACIIKKPCPNHVAAVTMTITTAAFPTYFMIDSESGGQIDISKIFFHIQ